MLVAGQKQSFKKKNDILQHRVKCHTKQKNFSCFVMLSKPIWLHHSLAVNEICREIRLFDICFNYS